MPRSLSEMQPVLAHMAGHLGDDISLDALAAETGLSRFYLHRAFSATLGETPKQVALRLRLGRAAALLLTTGDSVLDVALSCGFRSHEVFCRAFRRCFGMTPTNYRERGFANGLDRAQARQHAAAVNRLGPCVGLYYIREGTQKEGAQKNDMTYSVTKNDLAPQPVLVVRRTVKRSDIAATIGETLPRIFMHAQQHGMALVGQPFTRYVEIGPGLVTIEPGMCVATGAAPAQPAGENQVRSDTLPGGAVAATTHSGSYEKLPDAYAAIEEWAKAEGLALGRGLWEVYVTDPADFPDPKDWKTDVFWPLA